MRVPARPHASAEKKPRSVFAALGNGDTLKQNKFVRNLNQNPRAVTRAAVRAFASAMNEIFQNQKRVLDDGVRFRPVNVRDKPDTASVVLKFRRIKTDVFLPHFWKKL